LQKEVPDDGSSESKHVALCDVTAQCYVGLHMFFCLWYRKKEK